MAITGHKTRSVFERYNIVSTDDIRDAAKKQQDYIDDKAGIPREMLEVVKKQV
jgi:hypothetical protein